MADLTSAPGAVMCNNADFWVMEYLLEQDRVSDELIKQFCEGLSRNDGLPSIVQLRLMLRVLHGQTIPAVTLQTLQALGCLTEVTTLHDPNQYPPYTNLRAAKPPPELVLQASVWEGNL
jgi:hypothetical protein